MHGGNDGELGPIVGECDSNGPEDEIGPTKYIFEHTLEEI
jgi:hypothetical protein